MSKKHYIEIAEELNAARQLAITPDALAAVERIIEGLANILARNNARFNRSRFLEACGSNSPCGLSR